MQKKLLSGLTALIAVLMVLTGCPTETTDGTQIPGGPEPGQGGAPVKPVFYQVQRGYEFKDSVNLATVVRDDSRASEDKVSPVISLTWKATDGASSYNIYQAKKPAPVGSETVDDPVRPETPVKAGITDGWYFARGLDAESEYFFWLEAVNAKGSTFSDSKSQTTNKAGWQTADSGVERGDYARDMKVVAGDGSLTVSWSLSDRVGWYEVYYTTETTDADIDPRIGESWTTQPAESSADGLITSGSPASAHGLYGLRPYKFDDFFNKATMIPWTGTAAGTPKTPVKFFGLSTKITGLTNGTEYIVWVRCPNANGERGFSYVKATPGAASPDSIPAVSGIKVTEGPASLTVSWDKVSGAGSYRLYVSKYDTTPAVDGTYITVGGNTSSSTVSALDGNFVYYVWVVAVKGTSTGPFGEPIRAVTKPASGGGSNVTDTAKVDLRGNTVRNVVYIEVNDSDPRVAMGYELEDSNIPFFDYVILFAANLRNRDCEAEFNAGGANHICKKKGVHLHYNGNVQHILDNRDKYIKPLQDKGIKVILGLLGDWGGVGFGTMGEWPMEAVYPWATAGNPGDLEGKGVYPYTKAVRQAFLKEVKDEIERLGLDGVDFDDEWASANQTTKGLAVYPSQASYGGTAAAWAKCGVNFANLIADARDILGPQKTITVFEWQSARYMTIAANLTGNNGGPVVLDNGATIDKVHDYYDYITEASYGSWNANGYNAAPHAKYAPVGIDICGGDNPTAPRPAISGTTGLAARMGTFMAATEYYGVNMFYALQSQAIASKPFGTNTNPKLWDSSRGRTLTQAEYLSLASYVIYGENVIYVGADYPQDWGRW